MSSLSGTLATSAINQPIVKWIPFPVLLFSGSHDSYNLYLKLELEYLRVIKIQNLVLYCTIIDLYCTLEACGRWVPFVKKKKKKSLCHFKSVNYRMITPINFQDLTWRSGQFWNIYCKKSVLNGRIFQRNKISSFTNCFFIHTRVCNSIFCADDRGFRVWK